MWYGKFLAGKDCSKECYKESSTMITREGRQYGRTLFNYIFNKAPEVFGYIPILVDCSGRRMSRILAFQL